MVISIAGVLTSRNNSVTNTQYSHTYKREDHAEISIMRLVKRLGKELQRNGCHNTR